MQQLGDWAVTDSPEIPFGEGHTLPGERTVVVSELAFWAIRLRAATLPPSVEGTEYVDDILGGAA